LADRHGLRRPIVVKIAPDVTDEQIDIIASVTRECGMDGLIATNTTISRSGVEMDPLASESGGLDGRRPRRGGAP
jgi:dihydroorotate dehydrogenase